MDIERIKKVIRKRKGMLSDAQLAKLEELLKNGEITENDKFDLREYAHKCVMGLEDNDEADQPEDVDDEPMDFDIKEDPFQLLDKAVELLKGKYAPTEEDDAQYP